MFIDLQYHLLKRIVPVTPDWCSGRAYRTRSKLELLLGRELLDGIAGKTVIDFGCGEGTESIELALSGATRVIGVDIREDCLERARRRAEASGVADVCEFASSTESLADVIVSLDAFEHFAEPGRILQKMSSLMARDGEVLASFGPTWLHPLGGHAFSVFTWSSANRR
jgi:2-polyprenyl-3-methyl-5-hydroxy-6-metoxy-1,4-benzoquinol methylase